MMARKLNFGEDGDAELLDDRVFLMDCDMITTIGELAGDDTAYEIGEEAGKHLAANVKQTGIAGTKMDAFMMDLLTMMGLGAFEVHEFDITSKDGEIWVKNGIMSESTGDAGCAVIAGMLAGVFSENYDPAFDAEESACVARGDDLCRFKLHASE